MRTKYLLLCQCGQKLAVESAQAGQEVPCSCGRKISVPTMQRLRQLEQVVEQASVGAAGKSWNPIAAMVLIGMAILVASGLWTWRTYQGRPMLPPMEQIGPWESFIMWQELRTGVRMPEFTEVPYLEAERRYRQKFWIGMAFTGFGAAMVAASIIAHLALRSRRVPRKEPEAGAS